MPPKRESRRTGGDSAANAASGRDYYQQYRPHRRQDGFTSPTAEDRREATLLAELRALGYRIAVPCRVCGHMLTARRSVDAFMGPKCRGKAVSNDA